jgi:hypothetical protein
MPTDSIYSKPCNVCLVPHDDEIHAATLSVRDWFRDQVTQGLYDSPEEPAGEPDPLLSSQVA